MSIFDFFRRSKPTVNNSQNATDSETETATVDKALFVDNQEPEIQESPKKKPNAIEQFMDQDFEWLGYHDGYAYPDKECLETKLCQLKADFRLAVDKCLDVKRTEVGELNIHIIRTEGISPRLQAQLAEKIKNMEAVIHELDIQKILSVEEEGIIGSSVHAYRLGFRKGIERYQQEKFLGGSTGLFNQ